jgi:hypothetical protein
MSENAEKTTYCRRVCALVMRVEPTRGQGGFTVRIRGKAAKQGTSVAPNTSRTQDVWPCVQQWCDLGATAHQHPVHYLPRSSSHITGSWIIHVWFMHVQHFDVRIDKIHETSLALMTYLVHAGSFPLEVVPRDCGAILAA